MWYTMVTTAARTRGVGFVLMIGAFAPNAVDGVAPGMESEVVSPWVALPDCTPKSPTIGSRPHPLQVMGSYPIQPIAGLPNANGHFMTFGDTDHDALNEVILWWKEFLNPGTELHYRILEGQGGNVYASEYIGPT